MIRRIGPHEMTQLIAAGVDVVDVREAREWAGGHIPGARHVPLATLGQNPGAHLPQDRVIFVCAHGVRSLSAATLAQAFGLSEVYSLDGGTSGWAAAGLPLQTPVGAQSRTDSPRPTDPRAAATAEVASLTAIAPTDAACTTPEPSLDAVVGANLREQRLRRGLSLDELARQTGLSRALLGQIEIGRASASVSVVWKIARAFDVPFSALLSSAGEGTPKVLRRADALRLVSPDGRFASRALFPLHEQSNAVEFYELFLAAHSREDAAAHQAGTRENLIVTSGQLQLEVGGERFELGPGDAIAFLADVPHAYVNPSGHECWMYLVMTYAQH